MILRIRQLFKYKNGGGGGGEGDKIFKYVGFRTIWKVYFETSYLRQLSTDFKKQDVKIYIKIFL